MVIYHILFLKRTGIANLAWDSPFSKDPLPVFVYTQKRGLFTSSTLIEASPNAFATSTSKSPRRGAQTKQHRC